MQCGKCGYSLERGSWCCRRQQTSLHLVFSLKYRAQDTAFYLLVCIFPTHFHPQLWLCVMLRKVSSFSSNVAFKRLWLFSSTNDRFLEPFSNLKIWDLYFLNSVCLIFSDIYIEKEKQIINVEKYSGINKKCIDGITRIRSGS